MADEHNSKPAPERRPPMTGPRWAWILGAVIAGVVLMAVFNRAAPPPASEPVPPPEPLEIMEPATGAAPGASAPPTDAWVGTWTGVEGLRLDIEKAGTGYKLRIVNMDGAGDYDGAPDGAAIVFERAGKTERITHGDGEATGLKWLAGQTNCLVIKPGEGFCRPEGKP